MHPIIERVFDAIIRIDKDLNIKFISDTGLRWFGGTTPVISTNLKKLTLDKDHKTLDDHMTGTPKSFNCYVRFIRNGEEPTWVNLRASLTPHIEQYLICVLSVDDFQCCDLELLHAAEHDSLTQVANRAKLTRTVEEYISSGKMSFAVALLDLDGFKKVNDTLGHHAGDEVLIETVRRLNQVINPDTDFIARLGGDEFVIVMDDAMDQERINLAMSNVLYAISRPYIIAGNDAYLGCSIGLANYPEHAETYTDLLKNADTAMYVSKEHGKNRVTTYEEVMSTQDLSIKNALHVGIQEGEFYLEYQPVYNRDGKLIGAEALMRWTSSIFGKMSPAEFIAVAEDSGLMIYLGNWAIRYACHTLKEFHEHDPDFAVSVNVSPLQFTDQGFCENIMRAITEAGIEPRHLVLEITESTLMKSISKVEAVLNELRDKGIRFSIDDFGTGFSSISYLTQLPVSSLKIDKSFVKATENQDLNKETPEKKLLKAMIQLAHSIDLKCVAEGIETREQLTQLRNVGCDYFQGYLLSKPVSSEGIIDLLRRKK